MKRLLTLLILTTGAANAFTVSPSDVIPSTISRASLHHDLHHNGITHTHTHHRSSSSQCQSIIQTTTNGNKRSSSTICHMSTDEQPPEEEFWEKQKKLISDFADREEKVVQKKEKTKYSNKVSALVLETSYFTILIFSTLWLLSSNFFTPVSYLLGASLGTAYCFGLGQYVSTVGGTIDDFNEAEGSAIGSARFAFLILLIVIIGKFRGVGFQEIPAISGFFTYQIASLSQGLKDAGD